MGSTCVAIATCLRRPASTGPIPRVRNRPSAGWLATSRQLTTQSEPAITGMIRHIGHRSTNTHIHVSESVAEHQHYISAIGRDVSSVLAHEHLTDIQLIVNNIELPSLVQTCTLLLRIRLWPKLGLLHSGGMPVCVLTYAYLWSSGPVRIKRRFRLVAKVF